MMVLGTIIAAVTYRGISWRLTPCYKSVGHKRLTIGEDQVDYRLDALG